MVPDRLNIFCRPDVAVLQVLNQSILYDQMINLYTNQTNKWNQLKKNNNNNKKRQICFFPSKIWAQKCIIFAK